jgi:Trk K+ transport system NAD-binding subunit
MQNVTYVLLRRLRIPLIVLICMYTVSVLGFVLIPGIDDQGRPWRMDFFHAFYFVSFMGSTIGFGEIPYTFTNTQRMWTTLSIYGTVIAWLYGIGTMLSIIQDRAFRALIRETAFRRTVRRISEPFYIVCGYGDTGAVLVSALSHAGIRSVVIDIDEHRINAVEIEDLGMDVPAFCADAADPDILNMAGLSHPRCAGVLALTNRDHVNLTISITSTVIRPGLRTIARAETDSGGENIASLGDVEVINPFQTFASRLELALHAPGLYVLVEWLTGVPRAELGKPVFPPHGKWIVCGFGRFGKTLYKRLTAEGITVQLIELDPEGTQAPEDTVLGVGTDAETLQMAGVKQAAGLVAGTNNDADNLSIIITARALNPKLFIVGRQNQRVNEPLFEAAELDLVMQRGKKVANKIFALLTTPLLSEFLDLAARQDNEWANQLVSRIGGVLEDRTPQAWTVSITPAEAPAVYRMLYERRTITIGDLLRDHRDREQRLPAVPLLLKRDRETQLVPDESIELQRGDRVLFAGRPRGKREMDWTVRNPDVLYYVVTGREPASTLIGRLLRPDT